MQIDFINQWYKNNNISMIQRTTVDRYFVPDVNIFYTSAAYRWYLTKSVKRQFTDSIYLVSVFGDFSSYETFASAAKEPKKSYYIIGYLDTTQGMQYDPKVDANHFTFFAKDKAGIKNKVIFNGEKPRDIEKSEQIVMMGYMDGDTFHCSKIQMKCPSKYKKDQVVVGKQG